MTYHFASTLFGLAINVVCMGSCILLINQSRTFLTRGRGIAIKKDQQTLYKKTGQQARKILKIAHARPPPADRCRTAARRPLAVRPSGQKAPRNGPPERIAPAWSIPPARSPVRPPRREERPLYGAGAGQ